MLFLRVLACCIRGMFLLLRLITSPKDFAVKKFKTALSWLIQHFLFHYITLFFFVLWSLLFCYVTIVPINFCFHVSFFFFFNLRSFKILIYLGTFFEKNFLNFFGISYNLCSLFGLALSIKYQVCTIIKKYLVVLCGLFKGSL